MNNAACLLMLFALIFTDNEVVQCLSYREPVQCNVKVQSYSSYEPCTKPVEGYVILNNNRVWEAGWCSEKPTKRGVTLMTVDPVPCSPGHIYQFDTFASDNAAADLATLLQWIDGGSIVVGVTGEDASFNLAPALRVLRIAGVDVQDVAYRGNFAFVLQKGFPLKTQLAKSINNAFPFSTLEVNVIASYDDMTRSSSGCQCYWDKSRYDCACCYPGFCACGANFRGQCVKCGVGGDCGQFTSMTPVSTEIIRVAALS